MTAVMEAPRPSARSVRSSAPAVILGWLVVAIYRFAHHITYNFPIPFEYPAAAVYYLFDAVRWSAFTLLVLWFIQRWPAASVPRRKLVTVIVPLLVGSAVVMLMTDMAVFSVASSNLNVPWPNAIVELIQKRFHRMLLDATTVLIIAYGIDIQRSLAAEALRNARLEAAMTEARLTALRQQLHPHLLFNTLNSISALIRRQPLQAEQMLAHLSDLLRAILRVGHRTMIPLREDVAFAEAFLRIQEYRFPLGLRAETDIPLPLLDAPVPPLLLQPLVENSVKHGLSGRVTAPAVISIRADHVGPDLVLQVRDPGEAALDVTTREGFGVGLGQIRERLAQMYGKAASVDLSSSPGDGTTVTIRLPLDPPDAATV